MLVDLKNPWMMPARDPLRSLIFHAADRAVRDVYVDGERGGGATAACSPSTRRAPSTG